VDVTVLVCWAPATLSVEVLVIVLPRPVIVTVRPGPVTVDTRVDVTVLVC